MAVTRWEAATLEQGKVIIINVVTGEKWEVDAEELSLLPPDDFGNVYAVVNKTLVFVRPLVAEALRRL